MTEEDKNDKYIICSDCRSKYINDEEHINTEFGYTRLEMRYKTCVKCRARKQIKNKVYHGKHPEKAKEHYEAHKEQAKEYDKQYREKNADRLKEYGRAGNQVRDQIQVKYPNCNCEIVKRLLTVIYRHRNVLRYRDELKIIPLCSFVLLGLLNSQRVCSGVSEAMTHYRPFV